MLPFVLAGVAILILLTHNSKAALSPAAGPMPQTGAVSTGLGTSPFGIAPDSSGQVNPNVIRLEGGPVFAEPQPSNVPNVVFQSGRDPVFSQPPLAVVTSETFNPTQASQTLAAVSTKPPAVSLGPTQIQQQASLLSGATAGTLDSSTSLAVFQVNPVSVFSVGPAGPVDPGGQLGITQAHDFFL